MAKKDNPANKPKTSAYSGIKIIEPEKLNYKNSQFPSSQSFNSYLINSIKNKEEFWGNASKDLHWFNDWTKVKSGKGFDSKWFVGGKTNIAYNCLDRHLNSETKNKAALIWESEPGKNWILTYQLLHSQVCRLANGLKKLGIRKGDHVAIYTGMIPETVFSILACARLGAVFTIVNTGFASPAIKRRIKSNGTKLIITVDAVYRKGSLLHLKKDIDDMMDGELPFEKVLVFKRIKDLEISLVPDRDILASTLLQDVPDYCDAVPVESQHPLFSIFTYCNDGNIEKRTHTTGGYMVQAYESAKTIFDLRSDDTFWCASDLSWISGMTYGVFGPLLNGITTFLYEGIPIYPSIDRYWELIDSYKISVLYSSPTTIRGLLKLSEDEVKKHNLYSLRLIALKGEPVRENTWNKFFSLIGKRRIPIIDTWLQSETGTALLSPIPGISNLSPGLTNSQLPGVELDVVNYKGESLNVDEAGYLVIKESFPSFYLPEEPKKFTVKVPLLNDSYFTGDAAIKLKDGFYKILGRIDNIIKVGGNRVGKKEIEDLLLTHPKVKEAVVIRRPDEVIGEAIIVYVRLNDTSEASALLKEELRNFVSENIGNLAKPDELIFTDEFKRTQDGKIDIDVLLDSVLNSMAQIKGREGDYFRKLVELRSEFMLKLYKVLQNC